MMNFKYKNVCTKLVFKDDINNVEYRKEKIKYDTHAEAIEVARKINLKGKNVYKVVAYKCNTCFKYHIGRNKTLLKK